MAVASFAVSAGGALMEHQAQSQAAKEQNRYYEQNRLNAIAAFQDRQVAYNNRIVQEQEAASAEKFDLRQEAKAAQATSTVAAGEAGISGLSVEGLARDFAGREARAKDRIDQQTDWTTQQLQAEKKADGYTTLNQINSVRKAVKPNFAAAGLKIAAAGLNSYSSYKTNTGGWK